MNTEQAKITIPDYRPSLTKKMGLGLFILDIIGLYIFWIFAQWIFNPNDPWQWTIPFVKLWPYFFLIVFLYVFEMYKVSLQISGLRSAPRTFVAVLTACIVIVFFNNINPFTKALPLKLVAANFGLFSLWASFWRYLITLFSEAKIEKIKWLVVDPENIFADVYPQFVKKHFDQSFCILTDHELKTQNDFLQKLGSLDDFNSQHQNLWSGVVITNAKLISQDHTEILMNMRLRGIRVYNLHQFYEQFLYKLPVNHLKKDWLAIAQGFDLLHNPIGLKFKRITDLCLAITLLIATCPFLFITCILVKITSHGPILFTQIRTGENGNDFILYKFRSMVLDAEKHGAQWATKNDSRITKFGKILRLSRLDELPQLWNVFKGDMSFIGPRPERPEFNTQLEKQIPFYNLRHLVKPGITGWAQVLYPYGANIEDAKEKLEYDLYYIKNYSLFLDISILFKTVRVMILGKGQ